MRDVAESVAWYQRVLGLERVHEDVWGDFPAVVSAGSTGLALFPVPSEARDSTPEKPALAIRHIAFRTDATAFLQAQRHLTDLGIAFQPQDHRISRSIYLRDPNGHEIEITTYEVAQLDA